MRGSDGSGLGGAARQPPPTLYVIGVCVGMFTRPHASAYTRRIQAGGPRGSYDNSRGGGAAAEPATRPPNPPTTPNYYIPRGPGGGPTTPTQLTARTPDCPVSQDQRMLGTTQPHRMRAPRREPLRDRRARIPTSAEHRSGHRQPLAPRPRNAGRSPQQSREVRE